MFQFPQLLIIDKCYNRFEKLNIKTTQTSQHGSNCLGQKNSVLSLRFIFIEEPRNYTQMLTRFIVLLNTYNFLLLLLNVVTMTDKY